MNTKPNETKKEDFLCVVLARLITNLVSLFGSLGCVIFFTMISVSKARKEMLLKIVNKHFLNFIGHNQLKMKSKNGMKSSLKNKIAGRSASRRKVHDGLGKSDLITESSC